jgi:hypothetical protein
LSIREIARLTGVSRNIAVGSAHQHQRPGRLTQPCGIVRIIKSGTAKAVALFQLHHILPVQTCARSLFADELQLSAGQHIGQVGSGRATHSLDQAAKAPRSDVMRELGRKRLDASLGMAMTLGSRLEQDLISISLVMAKPKMLSRPT